MDSESTTTGRRKRIVWLVVAVLLLGWIVGGTMVTNHNEDAPLEPVREYLAAIARGDATAANALVDPSGFAEDVDPRLLTDEVLGAAAERLVVGSVTLPYDADLDADVVTVDVSYTVAGEQRRTELRVQRAGSTVGVLDEWRVIDPLLAPATVQSAIPTIDRAPFAGAVFPAGGYVPYGWPARRFFVYPAAYKLTGVESRYVRAAPTTLIAVPGYDGEPAEAYIDYGTTKNLTTELDRRMTDQVNACFAALPAPPAGCPAELRAHATQTPTLVRLPMSSLYIDQVEYHQRDNRAAVSYTAGSGLFDYAGGTEAFGMAAQVSIDADDQLTVTFLDTR